MPDTTTVEPLAFRPARSGQPVTGFWVQADCPNCGGDLEHVANPAPGWRTLTALTRCTDCRKYVRVRVQLYVHHPGDRQRLGGRDG